jgi:hypothetical protein
MRIYICNRCSKIHLEIGNTHIHFSSVERLKVFLNYLDSIDVAYYVAINRSKGLSKEIILPLGEYIAVNLAFTTHEFEAFKGIIRNYLSGKPGFRQSFVASEEFRVLNWN